MTTFTDKEDNETIRTKQTMPYGLAYPSVFIAGIIDSCMANDRGAGGSLPATVASKGGQAAHGTLIAHWPGRSQ